jgi:putative membrane protein
MNPARGLAWLLLAVTLAFALPGIAQTSRDSPASQPSRDAGKTSMSKQDAKLLEELARANMAEVALGKLAEQRASSGDVRQFGKHMVDDHSKMLDQGGKIAKSKNVEPPSSPDKKQQANHKKLEGLSGEQFDRAFMEQMVKDHEQALKLVNQAAQKATDPELKAMALEAVPEVEQHLKMARELSSKSGGARQGRTSSTKGS